MLADDERALLCAHLERTRDLFLASIRGLAGAEWQYRPAPEAWSIAEIAEHVAAGESGIFARVQSMLAGTAEPGRRGEVAHKDKLLIERVPVRVAGRGAQAPAAMLPSGRWPGAAEVAEAFEEGRRRTLHFVSTTAAPLRDHYEQHPAVKLLDAYQWLLMISVHTERHAAQIAEWKSSPDYPHA